MASFNRVILVGNLTRDPELRYTPTNTPVTEIGLAVNDRRKNAQGEWIEETTFVDVTLWARTAEVASEYLTKGASVLIEGRLKLDTWETDGQKRSKLRVIGERMQMLGGRGGGGGGEGGGRGAARGGAASGGGRGGPSSYDESEYGPPADVYGGSSGGGSSGGGSRGGSPPADDIPF